MPYITNPFQPLAYRDRLGAWMQISQVSRSEADRIFSLEQKKKGRV